MLNRFLVQITFFESLKSVCRLGLNTAIRISSFHACKYLLRFLFVGLFTLGMLLQVSAQSLLQKGEYFTHEGIGDGEYIELTGDVLRSDLPDHFVAASVMPFLEFEAEVISLDEENAAVIFLLAETGGRDLELLLNVEFLQSGESIHYYRIGSESSQKFERRQTPVFSEKERGKLVVEWNGSADRTEEILKNNPLRNAYLHNGSLRSDETGFGTSLECHINVSCPEGLTFNEVKDGINRIRVVVEEGIGHCSGALINNTAEDHTPYLLTAYHCMDGFTPIYDMWRFDFFYESLSCSDPQDEPGFFSLTGAEFRAGHPDTDFLLLELTEDFPGDFEVPFLGWDRREDYLPQNTALIHHPSADIKKVSLYSSSLRVHPNQINWNNGVTTPRQSHYRQNLTSGTFEPGSSGSPLLSPEGRIMGQLHGGNPSCSTFLAYSGILYYSWDLGDDSSERLRDWLDPLNTGQLTLDPSLREAAFDEFLVHGVVNTPAGQAVGMVEVTLECGDESWETVTEADGLFNFEVSLPAGVVDACQLSFRKNVNPRNGVNVLDIAVMRRHILNIEPLEDYPFQAADLNGDGVINVIDIAILRRLILQIIDQFPDSDSWKMLPDELDFDLNGDPDYFFEVTGLKMGDVDFSANPSN